MRLDEIRAIVKRYFEDALADYTDKLNARGLSDRQRQLIADEIGILKSGEEQQNNELSDLYITPDLLEDIRAHGN